MSELVSALKRASRGEVQRDVPLAPRTSVRVGGPAQLWVRPRDPEALVDITPAALASLRLDVGQRVWLTAKATEVVAYPAA